MRTRCLLRAALLPSLFALLTLPASMARAGVVMKFEHREAGAEKPTPGSVWIDGDRLRTETDGQVVIFRADKGTLWTWATGKKEYMELTREQAQQMGGVMAEMQKQLASLPPEQRAMAEQMMAARMGAMASRMDTNTKAPEPMVVTPLGKTETIHGWACAASEVRRGGKVEGEYWLTPWEQFHLSAADLAVFGKLADFLREATGGMTGAIQDPFAQRYGADGLQGIPVRVISPGAKGGSSTQEIVELKVADNAASLFELPPGMTKQSMGIPGQH